MYWYNTYPYPYSYSSKIEDDKSDKYSTSYLASNVGKWVKATLNYTSNSPINQNVECIGILEEVGNDYFVISEKGEPVLFYTVNLARLRILKNPPTSSPQKKSIETKAVRNRKAVVQSS